MHCSVVVASAFALCALAGAQPVNLDFDAGVSGWRTVLDGGMGGALDAMRTGYVDEAWAKEHHEYWYNDIKAGRIPAGDEAGPPMQHRPA